MGARLTCQHTIKSVCVAIHSRPCADPGALETQMARKGRLIGVAYGKR